MVECATAGSNCLPILDLAGISPQGPPCRADRFMLEAKHRVEAKFSVLLQLLGEFRKAPTLSSLAHRCFSVESGTLALRCLSGLCALPI
jgi:hypothetical protein